MKKEQSLELLNSVYEDILNMSSEDIEDFNNTVRKYALENGLYEERTKISISKDSKLVDALKDDIVEEKDGTEINCFRKENNKTSK